MQPYRPNDEQLLDYHLGQQSAEDRECVEHAIEHDESVRRRSGRVAALLQPLDYWTSEPPSPDLADRILRRAGALVDYVPVESITGRFRPGTPAGWRRFTRREVFAAAACIALIVLMAGPGLSAARSRAYRVRCADNLRGLCGGVGMYQEMFAGALPFAGSTGGGSWLPAEAASDHCESNSRHIYLLVRLDLCRDARQFLCPAQPVVQEMDGAVCRESEDFPQGRRNMNFDSLNLADGGRYLRPTRSVAYLSDPNPLFISGSFREEVDPYRANSPVHDNGAGQNVLTLDGVVTWCTTPVVGPSRDNVWLAGDIRHYTGVETRQGPDDAFLIPGKGCGDDPPDR